MASERLGERSGLVGIAERELDQAPSGPPSILNANTVMRRLRRGDIGARPYYDFAKRLFDIAVASLALFALLPVILAVAALIKLDTPGPVLFRQDRLGKGTRRFVMLKFRSMKIDCDVIPQELAEQNESTGPLFKMRNDPRITRVGRILRRTSLDELPQLINVLRGEMTIVGPRPPLPRELTGFENIQRRRLQVKPGLAGLWQMSGRSNLSFDEMVRLDLEYIDRRSFWYDLKLILQTVPAVLLGRGAY